MENKKILIIGSSAKEYALSKKFVSYGFEVFVAPGNKRISDIAKCIDIREDKPKELLEFVLENAIDLTVASGELSIKSDVSTLFQSNGQLIFAPSAKSAGVVLSRSAAKKFLYKNRIPNPRFGVFDKVQQACDYLKNAQMPQVIYADKNSNYCDRLVCTTYNASKTFVEDLFSRGEDKVVLEDYIYGHEFTFYIVTDGYHALPLASVANYKFMEDGNGGILTSGIGAYTPDYKISKEIENSIMKNVVNNTIQSLEKNGVPYLGILGIDCILKDDGRYVVLGFRQFLSDHDCEAVLNTVDENLFTLFEACAVGSFADDYDSLKISNNSSVSCVVSSRCEDKVISGLDFIEGNFTPFNLNKNSYMEFETVSGKNFVLTSTARTLSRARTQLYDDLEQIKFDGIKYRKDICEKVENF